MAPVVDFVTVSSEGVESSPVSEALARLRANEARYCKNKYDHVTVTPASEAPEVVDYAHGILERERDLTIASRPLEVSALGIDGIRMAHVFHESRLSINVMYALAGGGKRAVGFKFSDGMDVPDELADRFTFARQTSKLPRTIRGSYFVIKGKY